MTSFQNSHPKSPPERSQDKVASEASAVKDEENKASKEDEATQIELERLIAGRDELSSSQFTPLSQQNTPSKPSAIDELVASTAPILPSFTDKMLSPSVNLPQPSKVIALQDCCSHISNPKARQIRDVAVATTDHRTKFSGKFSGDSLFQKPANGQCNSGNGR